MLSFPLHIMMKTPLPIPLRMWGKAQQMIQFRWLQIFQAKYDPTCDAFDVCGRPLTFAVEAAGWRYYVGIGNPGDLEPEVFYWLGVAVAPPDPMMPIAQPARRKAWPASSAQGGYRCVTSRRIAK